MGADPTLGGGWDEVAAQASRGYHLAAVLQALWDSATGEQRVWLTLQGVPSALTKAKKDGLLPSEESKGG